VHADILLCWICRCADPLTYGIILYWKCFVGVVRELSLELYGG